MASSDYLLGIGYRHVKGGEDSFEQGSRKIRASAKDAGKEVSLLDLAGQSLGARFSSLITPTGLFVAAVGGLATALVSAGLAAKKALDDFAAFEQAMRNVQAAGGLTDAQLRTLTDSALAAAKATRFDPGQTAEALYNLASAGFSVEQSMQALLPVLNFAEAAQTDLALSSDTLVSTLKAFRLEADQTTRVADVFTAASAVSALNAQKLNVALANAGPTAAGFGHDLEETVAALGSLTDVLGKGERAGTGYQAVLNELKDKHKKLGIEIKDSAGNYLPMIEVLKNMEKVGFDAQNAIEIFGNDAGPALAILLQKGSAGLADMTSKLGSTGQAAETAGKQMDTLKGDQEQLAGAIEEMWIRLGEALSGGQRTLLQEITSLVSRATEWIVSHADEIGRAWGAATKLASEAIRLLADTVVFIVEHLDDFKAAVYALGAVLLLMGGQWLAGVIGSVTLLELAVYGAITATELWTGAVAFLTGAWNTFTVALAANPIGAIAVAIGLLVFALQQWINKTEQAWELELKRVRDGQSYATYLRDLKSLTDVLTESEAAHGRQMLANLEIEAKTARVLADKLRRRDESGPIETPGGTAYPTQKLPLTDEAKDAESYARQLENTQAQMAERLRALGGLSDETITVLANSANGANKSFELLDKGMSKTLATARLAAERAEALFAAQQAGLPVVLSTTRSFTLQDAALEALEAGNKKAAAQLSDFAARAFDAKRKTDLLIESQQRVLAIDQAIATAKAKVTDASAGNTLASQAAARASEVEAFRQKFLLSLTDDRVSRLRVELELRDKELRYYEEKAAKVQRDLQWSVELSTAEAELTDAKLRNTSASHQLSITLEIETRTKAAGVEGDKKSINAIAMEVIGRKTRIKAIQEEIAARRAMNGLLSDASFGVAVSGISETNGRLRGIEESFLNFLRNLGEGTVVEGGRVFTGLTHQLVGTVDEIKAALGQIADSQVAQRAYGAGKSPLEAYREERSEIERLMNDSTSKVKISTEDGQAYINKITEDFWSAQIDNWASVFSSLGETFGGVFESLAQGAQIIQDAYKTYSMIKNAVVSAGGSENWGQTFGEIGAWLQIIKGIYDVWKGHKARREGRVFENDQPVVTMRGGMWNDGPLSDGWAGTFTAQLSQRSYEISRKIQQTAESFAESIGGTLASFTDLEIKIRRDGEKIRAFVAGAFIGEFNEIEEAISAAMAAAFADPKTTFRGLTALVQQALNQVTSASGVGGMGGSAEAMQDWLVQIREVAELGWSDAARGTAEATRHMESLWRALARVTNVTPEVTQGFADLGRAELSAWQAWSDSISGRERTEAEILADKQRDLDLFKAQKALRIAELEMRKWELMQQRAAVGAEGRILEAGGALRRIAIQWRMQDLEDNADLIRYEGGLQDASIRSGWAFATARAELVQAEAGLTNTYTEIVAAQLAAIDAILAGLAAMPDPTVGLGRAGGSGRNLADERRDFRDQLRDLARGGLPDGVRAMMELGDQLRDLTARARELRIADSELAAARAALIEQARRSILDPVRQYLVPEEGGTFGLSEWQTKAAEIEKLFDDARAANQRMIQETGQRAIEFWRLNEAEIRALRQLAEEAIASLGLPMESVRSKVKALTDTLRFLRDSVDDGILSSERFADVMRQLQLQSEGELLGMAQGLLEQMGQTEQAAKVKAALEEANFEMQVAQLNFLFQSYLALGLISDAVRVRMEEALAIINDPANRPDFNWQNYLPGAGSGGSSYTQPGFDSNGTPVAGANDNRRQEILDQINAWNLLGQSDTTRGLRELNARLVSISADAQRLGIDMGALQSAYQNAVEDFWDQTLEPFEEATMTTAAQRLAEINRQFDEMIQAAQQYGGDQARIEAARLAEIGRFWDEALEPIRSLQEQLSGGQFGGLSPEQRLLNAQQQFATVSAAAQGGDLNAINQLPSIVSTLLQEAQNYFGQGAAYQALVAQVQAVVAQILAMAPATTTQPLPSPGQSYINDGLIGTPFSLSSGFLLPANDNRRPAELPPQASRNSAETEVGPSAGGAILDFEAALARRDQEARTAAASSQRKVDALVERIDRQENELERLNKNIERLLGLLEGRERMGGARS